MRSLLVTAAVAGACAVLAPPAAADPLYCVEVQRTEVYPPFYVRAMTVCVLSPVP